MLFFVSIYLCKLPSLSARQYNLFSSFYHILTDLMNHSFCLTSLHLLWPNISYSPTQWFWCCWCTLTFPLKPPHFSPPQTNWIHISSCLVIGFVFIQSNNYSTVCFLWFMIFADCSTIDEEQQWSLETNPDGFVSTETKQVQIGHIASKSICSSVKQRKTKLYNPPNCFNNTPAVISKGFSESIWCYLICQIFAFHFIMLISCTHHLS